MTHPFRLALALALAGLFTACSSDPDRLPPTNPFKAGKSERELRLEADGLYRLARRSLDAADFVGASQRYDQILLRYPFTDYATQAQLESIYAKFRSYEADAALSTADRFLKEHPRHPSVDYVYYLKGLINFQRGESLFEGMVDTSAQDVSAARAGFDDFALLVQRYPNSRYAGDARLRMIHLRNKIATHELSIVQYYVRRGAFIAAAKRAEKIIADYPGAPATAEALVLLEESYREIGMIAQADEVHHLRDTNPAVKMPESNLLVERPGGLFGPPPDPIPEPSPTSGDAPVTTRGEQPSSAEMKEIPPAQTSP